MPIADVLDYAKSHNVPMSAVKCNPAFDTKKGRVSKGNSFAVKGWKDKGRYEPKNIKNTPHINGTENARFWFFNLKKAGMYVLDIDVYEGKNYKDVMIPEVLEKLMEACEYAVQTGSGGLHLYFKVPELEEYAVFRNAIKGKELKGFFKDGEKGEVDVIIDTIVCEGSSYDFNDETYKYISVKAGSSISDVSECEPIWEMVKDMIISTPESLENDINEAKNKPVDFDELVEHLNNIPNEVNNWDEWYKMGQTIFNVTEDGFDLFDNWSKKCKYYDARKTRDLWRGLSARNDGSSRSMGSILYLSKQSNETEYKKIRAKYTPLSYKALKQLIEQDHFFIEEPKPRYVRIRDRDVIEYSPGEVLDLFRSLKYPLVDNKGIEIEVAFSTSWMKDTEKRSYKRIDFYPNASECPKDVYNRFVPAEASFLPVVADADLSVVLKHIDVMSGNHQESADWIINFLAQIVQEPGKLPGMSIVLYSEQGAGKDILVDWFGEKVLGEHQYYKIGNAVNMFKSFNADLMGKMLIHSDEINKEIMVKYNEDLKRIITNGRMRLEGKGKDAIATRSYCRLFMTTNNRDALNIEHSDRRFCVFRSSSEHRSDAEYFKKLSAVMYKPETIRAFYDYLMKRDLSEFNHTKRPMSPLYKEMKEGSMDGVLRWIKDSEEDFCDEEQQRRTMYWLGLYNSWARSNNMKQHNATSFGTSMNELIEKQIGITKQIPKNVSHLTIVRSEIVEYLIKEGLMEVES
jgi:hypothetical protein